MSESLKASLLVSNTHECLAVDDGCTRLDAMIFVQINLIDIYLLFCRRQLLAILILCDRRDDGAVALFACCPWQCRIVLPYLPLNDLRRLLKEAIAAARSLRDLTDMVERNPEALLKGKKGKR